LAQHAKTGIMFVTRKYTKWPENMPNSHKIYYMALKILNGRKIYQLYTFQGLPKCTRIEILVWKRTIWQPCFRVSFVYPLQKWILKKTLYPGVIRIHILLSWARPNHHFAKACFPVEAFCFFVCLPNCKSLL
jgi:hypothetical protein